jgi:hypothetical protein
MLRTIVISVLGILLVFLIACSGEKKAETEMQQEPEAEMTTAVADSGNATCPACGMVMDKSEMIEYVAEGDTIHFCSEGCQKHYLAQQEEPETEE